MAKSPGSPPRRRWTGALRGRLVMLALAILIPALAATGLLLANAYQHQRAALEEQIAEQASSLRLVVDRQLGQDRVLIHALAASPALAAGDIDGFDKFARSAVLNPETWVVLVDDRGRQVVNTSRPRDPVAAPMRPLPNVPGSWSKVQADGTRISDVFLGVMSKSMIVAVTREAVLTDGRKVRISVVTSARSFGRIWREQGFPETWTGVVLDGRQRVVTRSRGGDRFIGMAASPSTQRRIGAGPTGVADTTTLDGVRSITAWNSDTAYGWTFLVAVPRDEVIGAARRSLLLASLSGLALLACGVGLAAWMARSIAWPVEVLTAAAKAWERGERPVLVSSGVTEIDELQDACAEAARRLSEQREALRDLNASLETRVAERTRELSDATESLVQAQKLEAIGRLTGGVAHDFNNLLMAVSGNLDLLKRRLTDAKQLSFVDQAKQAADRGAKLTGQLLAFSRKQRLQPRTVDVNAAIGETQALLASTLGGAVQVRTVSQADLWPALADPTQLELVILNLAINARDAMPGGGSITIETSNAVRPAALDSAEAPPAGEFVRVAITDTGTGMTAQVRDRVFEPFFTTKQIGQGSGLGLPQVLGLAKQLGGGVEIVSAPGMGTTVAVYLPRSAEAPAAAPAARPDLAAPSLAGARVLLVDDDPDVRGVTDALLTELGCAVTPVSDGLAAVDAVRAGGAFDVALLDYAMPGLNGGETAARLGAQRADLPMVMMSGFADGEALARQWTGPLLHKPFSAAALAQEIARAIGRADAQAVSEPR